MNLSRGKVVIASFAALAFTGYLAAQGRGPNSLQPDSSAVFLTFVTHRHAAVARGNVMILSSPHAPAPLGKPSSSGNGHKGGGGGGTGGGGGSTGGPSTITLGGSAYTAGVTVTPTTTQPEAEEEIAADPSDTAGNNLVAAISDFSSASGFNNTKWILSTNGGSSWKESFVPNNPVTGLLLTSDGLAWDANSDPVLAFDRAGNVFLADLYINVDSSGRITGEGFYVSVDTFSHLETGNFANTNPVLTNPNNGGTFNLEDKPWITVDNSGGAHQGTVYASWSHFTGCQNKFDPLLGAFVLTCTSDVIDVAFSTNHGQTWSAPIQISTTGQAGAVQGSQPAVGPDGKVYIAYEFFGSGNLRQQFLSVGSWSGGSLSFSAPFITTPVFNDLTFSGCSTCSASYRVNSFPNIGVGPATGGNASGNVYLVYGSQKTSTSEADVSFVACTASCTSPTAFNAPAIINDTSIAAEHFFPVIAVDSSGVVHTSWFDTRNSDKPIANPDKFDIYASFLTNTSGNAFTLSPNHRVTTTTIDASIVDGFGDTSFIGDYAGIAATAESKAHAHPVWTNANGLLGLLAGGSLQTATLSLP